MSNYFESYFKQVRRMQKNESNKLLKYIIKFTEGNHRWKGSLEDFIYIISRFERGLNNNFDIKEEYKNYYMFEEELKRISSNLRIRGITVFTEIKHGKIYVVVNKNLDNDFSGYYFCEEYMMQFF